MDALYRDFILDHYKNPRNFGELTPHDLDFHDHNPLCGDELGVHIVVEDGKVKDLRFHGQGCAISQAAASITSDELIGMPIAEIDAAACEIAQPWPWKRSSFTRPSSTTMCTPSSSPQSGLWSCHWRSCSSSSPKFRGFL